MPRKIPGGSVPRERPQKAVALTSSAPAITAPPQSIAGKALGRLSGSVGSIPSRPPDTSTRDRDTRFAPVGPWRTFQDLSSCVAMAEEGALHRPALAAVGQARHGV